MDDEERSAAPFCLSPEAIARLPLTEAERNRSCSSIAAVREERVVECAQLLLDEVMEREELRLPRKAHLLEHGTDDPSETLKRLL